MVAYLQILCNMTLDEYLYSTGLTLNEFAYSIDYHPNYLGLVKNGRKKASKRLQYVIWERSGGKVCLEGFKSPK